MYFTIDTIFLNMLCPKLTQERKAACGDFDLKIWRLYIYSLQTSQANQFRKLSVEKVFNAILTRDPYLVNLHDTDKIDIYGCQLKENLTYRFTR